MSQGNEHLMGAKAEVERHRARVRATVFAGEMSWADAVRAAVDDPRLRNQSLIQVISDDQSIGYGKARRMVGEMYRKLYPGTGAKVPFRRITVGWLISEWSSGRRFEALVDAIHDPRKVSMNDGFPWTYGKASNDDLTR